MIADLGGSGSINLTHVCQPIPAPPSPAMSQSQLRPAQPSPALQPRSLEPSPAQPSPAQPSSLAQQLACQSHKRKAAQAQKPHL